MKKGATLIARGALYVMGLTVIAICAILLPELAREEAAANPNAGAAWPFLIGAWILAIPIFIAIFETHKLLGYIDSNKAFSQSSVKALQKIKTCAFAFCAMILLSAASVIILAKIADPREEVTHIITLAVVFTLASSIIAAFAALLQKLSEDVIAMKSENDLTV